MIVVAQIRGTGYAAGEIIWWMLAALLLGIAIGWLLSSFRIGRRLGEEYAAKLASAEQRNQELTSRIEAARGAVAEGALETDRLRVELAAAQERIAELMARPEPSAVVGDGVRPGDTAPKSDADGVSDSAQDRVEQPESH